MDLAKVELLEVVSMLVVTVELPMLVRADGLVLADAAAIPVERRPRRLGYMLLFRRARGVGAAGRVRRPADLAVHHSARRQRRSQAARWRAR